MPLTGNKYNLNKIHIFPVQKSHRIGQKGKSSEVLPPEKCLAGPGLTGPPDDVTTDNSDNSPSGVLNKLILIKNIVVGS